MFIFESLRETTPTPTPSISCQVSFQLKLRAFHVLVSKTTFTPAVVDILAGIVLRIDEIPAYANYDRTVLQTLDLPRSPSNYFPNLLSGSSFRRNIRPLTTFSDGRPSFTVTGDYQVNWQGWQMTVGFNVREGLTLHGISYKEVGGKRRPLIYRLAHSEMGKVAI